VLTSSAVNRGVVPRLGQTKNYEIDICYLVTSGATSLSP
jgi:hypothetical protein